MVRGVLAQLALWRSLKVEEIRVTEETTRFAPVDLSSLAPHRATGS